MGRVAGGAKVLICAAVIVASAVVAALGQSSAVGVPKSAAEAAAAVAVSGGADFTCATTDDARVLCWGQAGYGQLGSPGPATASPRQVSNLGAVTDLSARGHSACAVAAGEVWCWGAGGRGQLGHGRTGMAAVPVRAAGIVDARTVTVSGRHACAVLADTSLMCWGAGTAGELGDGRALDSATPVLVTRGVRDVAVGDRHTCIATTAGFVRCWGDFGGGAQGESSRVPVPMAAPGASVAVSAGGRTTCSVIGTGAVWCWGGNWRGQVGSGAEGRPATPEHVMGLLRVDRMATGSAFTCAMRSDRVGVWCWGSNESHQLSDDSFASAAVPHTLLDAAGAVGVGAGDAHLCLTYSNGAVRCRGEGYAAGWVAVEGFTPYVPPPAPETLAPIVSADASSVDVRWSGVQERYSVDVSATDGQTWVRHTVTAVDGVAHWSRTGLQSGTALRLRIGCELCSQSEIVATTTGASLQRVRLLGPDGRPLGGARVHYRGGAAVRTDLSGMATLPSRAAGEGFVRLEPVNLPGGVSVAGGWRVLIGSGTRTLRIPRFPELTRGAVRAVREDGTPVAGANVAVEGLRDRAVVDGFTFRVAGSQTVTDAAGTATLSGFPILRASARARPARVLLLGDSHAAPFDKPLTRLAAEQGWEFKEIWRAGCPWVPVPAVRADIDIIGDCAAGLRAPARDMIVQWEPDLVVLMGRTVMVRAIASDSGPIEPGSAGWREIVESAAKETVDDYRALGVDVALVDPLPELGWDPYACLSGSITPETCSAPRVYPGAAGEWRAVQRDLSREVGVTTVDLTGLICPDTTCPMAIGGIPTRRDTQHLTRDYIDAVRWQLDSAFLAHGVDLRNGRVTTPMVTVTGAGGVVRADIGGRVVRLTLIPGQTH